MSDELNPARPDDDQTVSLLTRTRTLCGQCSNDVGVDGAAIAVFASDTSRDLVYATDITAKRIDELEFTLGEGRGRLRRCPRLDRGRGTRSLAPPDSDRPRPVSARHSARGRRNGGRPASGLRSFLNRPGLDTTGTPEYRARLRT
ncbi:hypothetical protein CBI38_06685 [Rhodococcus oxybenzonivorans]|uniref:Uncharacterized protein n=1 Tax=Rhodococcus oxybenzonivorans TaxID=1990687 RepID=A0A2S2BRT4_9NOCA|nr:hypothetical protein CBI38_06685 [Rhodococcus oxybenzonivorans]